MFLQLFMKSTELMVAETAILEKSSDSPWHHKAHDAQEVYFSRKIRSKAVRQYYYQLTFADTTLAPDIPGH
ncbi:hypothetical protein CFter6_2867 [Collimonas fungivorans]|uniref:Uncharacterized protein n=1 Tax=Collimonas fungivorans TaxID=158899 RepID=A0A127PCV2_9BURK|nr:hypothetical protein CFter6_2867 [Collimonas fungivorans]